MPIERKKLLNYAHNKVCTHHPFANSNKMIDGERFFYNHKVVETDICAD